MGNRSYIRDFNKIDFSDSYLVNYFIHNISGEDVDLLAFRILIKNSLNKVLKIDDDNYSYIDISTEDFKIDYIELESLDSVFLSNIIKFKKDNNKYQLAFRKGILLTVISFISNHLKITKGEIVKKNYLNEKKHTGDLLMDVPFRSLDI